VPPTYASQRAILYHAHKTDLKAWVKKKSLRGKADFDPRRGRGTGNPCPTCFTGLLRIAKEFLDEEDGTHGGSHTIPNNPFARKLAEFVLDMDAYMEGLLQSI